MIEAGQVAYESYVTYVGGLSAFTGEPLPLWDQQSEEVRAAWRAAADGVLMYASQEAMRHEHPS